MAQTKAEYLKELEQRLNGCCDRDQILKEYKTHILELEEESGITDEAELMKLAAESLGTPEEAAEAWNHAEFPSPVWTLRLFFIINLSFFTAGAGLTALHHLSGILWADLMWDALARMPLIILIIYSLFWALIGYEAGREFGYGGRVWAPLIFAAAILPNVLLMCLVLFELVPGEWFTPLLSLSFIISCIFATILLFPLICWMGFRIGKRSSV
ncbi:HAAS signaling domain-containing protein [Peribacillus sp. SCS-37]|uniref:HAAS signaling domain-containing protein n=1 Tax=Paraperibacillus esterisolvens TaxID=3115296 RepID=UPI0039065B52